MTAQRISNRLERTSPAEANIDPGHVLRYIEELDKLDCHSIMVLRHGRVAVEGWWRPYRAEYRHILYSLSKSFVSVAIGFAVREGLLALDERLVDIFPEFYPCAPCDHMRRVNLRHLLTMSIGHRAESDLDFLGSPDWLAEGLRLYLENEPGTDFRYDNRCTLLLSAALQKRVGTTVHAYLAERLYQPLGIAEADWEILPSGLNPGGWGMRATTESIARFGQFLLQRGVWNGKKLLDPDWIDEATAFHIDTRGKSILATEDCWNGYGYLFWRSRFPGAFRADGAVGQHIIVMPEQDMVVAMTAGCERRDLLLERTWDTLCPGIDKAGPDAAAVQAGLEQRLSGLSIPFPEGEGSPPESAAACSGRTYVLAENRLGISEVAVVFGECDVVSLKIGDAAFSFKAGHGEWLETVTGYEAENPSDVTQVFHRDVAAAAAWQNGEYAIRVVFNRTPYADHLRLRFSPASVVGEYKGYPAFRARRAAATLMGISSEP